MQRNPAYIQTTPTQPTINYSSLGPQDTPTDHTPPQGEGEERIYHVLEQPEERREERVYHVLEQPGIDTEREERVYHVLEQPQREGEEEDEEGAYQVLGEAREGHKEEEEEEEEEGMAYEVPIHSKSKGRDKSAGRAGDMEYSTLHHN